MRADHVETRTGHDDSHAMEKVRSALAAVTAAVVLVALVVGALAVVSAPGGWIMQAANEAILDQQAIATSYAIR